MSRAESNARFTFNFRDVYWNSRLQMEHHRLVDIIRRTAARRWRKAQSHGVYVYVCVPVWAVGLGFPARLAMRVSCQLVPVPSPCRAGDGRTP